MELTCSPTTKILKIRQIRQVKSKMELNTTMGPFFPGTFLPKLHFLQLLCPFNPLYLQLFDKSALTALFQVIWPHPKFGRASRTTLTSRSSLATSLSSCRMPSSCPITIFMRPRMRSFSLTLWPSVVLLVGFLSCESRLFILYRVPGSWGRVALHILLLPDQIVPPQSLSWVGRSPHFNAPPCPESPSSALTSYPLFSLGSLEGANEARENGMGSRG